MADGVKTVIYPVKDVGGGKLIATATDPNGNVIGLIQEP
jgi:predicted enzyme related to lactoylglutathione lyase